MMKFFLPRVTRNWLRRRRREAIRKDIRDKAVWQGIHRLYEERGEIMRPCVFEALIRMPGQFRQHTIGEYAAELQRIGWYGERGRRMLEAEIERIRHERALAARGGV